MRSKLIAIVLAVFALPIIAFADLALRTAVDSESQVSLNGVTLPTSSKQISDPPYTRFPVTLKQDDLDRLNQFAFRNTIESPYGRFLIITYTWGFGIVRVETYIYILKDDASWSLIAFIYPGDALGTVINKDMLLIKNVEKPAISIPLNVEAIQSARASASASVLGLPRVMVVPSSIKTIPDSILTKQIIESASGKFLIVTYANNPGPAHEEIYIYLSNETNFDSGLLIYVRSDNTKLSAAVKGDTILVTKKSGEIVAAISINTIIDQR